MRPKACWASLQRVASSSEPLREATADSGLGALLLTPGPDLRYVTGYDAIPLERLTCLVVPAADDPFLIVPRLSDCRRVRTLPSESV